MCDVRDVASLLTDEHKLQQQYNKCVREHNVSIQYVMMANVVEQPNADNNGGCTLLCIVVCVCVCWIYSNNACVKRTTMTNQFQAQIENILHYY